jgi:hypothetical protein
MMGKSQQFTSGQLPPPNSDGQYSQLNMKQSINYPLYQHNLSPSIERTHNPVTNPIDFKIGITNPYVIKEYENTKEKYMGDNNLKLRNLAMIGNNSLGHGY